MNKMNNISFNTIEIGDVLFAKVALNNIYYFISDKTEKEIYYSYYEFKGNIALYQRGTISRDMYQNSLLAGANSYAPKGELVKKLLEVSDIKDCN